MTNVLILGATRGLGASLATQYASSGSTTVYATTRSAEAPATPSAENIHWVTSVDMASPTVGTSLVDALRAHAAAPPKLDVVVVSAGYFGTESFDEPDWEGQVKMYTTSAVGPVFVVQALVKAGLVVDGAGKVVLVSSESGSVALRHESEGGGNYGHHASKAALNMVAKLLSLDLKDRGVTVVSVHPGFMRTEMTKGVGFDKYWDDGGGMLRPFRLVCLARPVHGFFLPSALPLSSSAWHSLALVSHG